MRLAFYLLRHVAGPVRRRSGLPKAGQAGRPVMPGMRPIGQAGHPGMPGMPVVSCALRLLKAWQFLTSRSDTIGTGRGVKQGIGARDNLNVVNLGKG